MIRPVFTEIALFAAPFVIYAVYLWVTRAGVFDAESWSWSAIGWLTIVALVLMLGTEDNGYAPDVVGHAVAAPVTGR